MAVMIGLGKPKDEGDDDGGLGASAKAAAGRKLASALGVKGDVDGHAVCEAVKQIMNLEYDEESE
jgi:hypothetical protein